MAYSEYYENLSRKIMGAGALFFNEDKQLLIVKPTYQDGWSIPGGVVDENESPLEACIREVKEEIGLDVEIKKFLCVHYLSATSDRPENVQFLFYGGVLTPKEIEKIILQPDELSEYKFLEVNEALALFREVASKRFAEAVKSISNNTTSLYLEDFRVIK